MGVSPAIEDNGARLSEQPTRSAEEPSEPELILKGDDLAKEFELYHLISVSLLHLVSLSSLLTP